MIKYLRLLSLATIVSIAKQVGLNIKNNEIAENVLCRYGKETVYFHAYEKWTTKPQEQKVSVLILNDFEILTPDKETTIPIENQKKYIKIMKDIFKNTTYKSELIEYYRQKNLILQQDSKSQDEKIDLFMSSLQ
jgi:hypothetical protein